MRSAVEKEPEDSTLLFGRTLFSNQIVRFIRQTAKARVPPYKKRPQQVSVIFIFIHALF